MALQNGRFTECVYTIGCFAGCIMDKLSLWPLQHERPIYRYVHPGSR